MWCCGKVDVVASGPPVAVTVPVAVAEPVPVVEPVAEPSLQIDTEVYMDEEMLVQAILGVVGTAILFSLIYLTNTRTPALIEAPDL
jgi:hypothetical protein